MNNDEHYYINIDLPDLIRYLRELKIPEDKIKLIVGYCVKRRDKEINERMHKRHEI